MGELRGEIVPGALPAVLRQVSALRSTGRLRLASGAEKIDISVVEGYLTEVVSTVPGLRLGDVLVKVGFLSARERDMSLELSALSHERLGATLLRHSLLDAARLAQGLSLQLREVIAHALCWPDGAYVLSDEPELASLSGSMAGLARVDPREVLLDAVCTLIGQPAVDALLGDLARKVTTPRAEWLASLASLAFRLTPADAFLLSRVDGRLTGEDLLQISPLSPAEAKASLAGLLAVGAVDFEAGPSRASHAVEASRNETRRLAARVASPDPWEALGVRGDADPDTIRGAYLRLLRSCAPEAAADSEQRALLIEIGEAAGRAYREIERRRAAPRPVPAKTPGTGSVLAPASLKALAEGVVEPKRPPTPSPEPVVAHPPVAPNNALEAAAHAYDQRRYHEALAILHDALPHLSGLARRGARVRKAQVLLAVENGARLAEEELKAAIAEDPGNVEAHETLGFIYKERGAHSLAAGEFRKVLELDPRHAAAREAVLALASPPASGEAREASVLQRIFRRPTS